MLRYFGAVSDAIGIGVMIYHAHWTAHGRIEIETFKKMTDFEHVMAIKWNTPADVPYEAMQELVADFNILDNSNQPGRCYKNGGQGFLDHLSPAYPAHDLEVLELLEAGKFDEGQAVWDEVCKPTVEFRSTTLGDSGGAARLKKAAMAIMGHPARVHEATVHAGRRTGNGRTAHHPCRRGLARTWRHSGRARARVAGTLARILLCTPIVAVLMPLSPLECPQFAYGRRLPVGKHRPGSACVA